MRVANEMNDIPSAPEIPEEHAQEAEKIWRMLDDMAENDPEAYAKFQASMKMQAAAEKKKSTVKSFMPDIGFCIRCDYKSENNKKKGTQGVYINICSSKMVKEPPKDDKDTVPCAVGEYRIDSTDPSRDIVDVIVASSVMERCSTDLFYRGQVCSLAMDCQDDVHPFKRKVQRSYIENPTIEYFGKKQAVTVPPDAMNESSSTSGKPGTSSKGTDAKNASKASSNHAMKVGGKHGQSNSVGNVGMSGPLDIGDILAAKKRGTDMEEQAPSLKVVSSAVAGSEVSVLENGKFIEIVVHLPDCNSVADVEVDWDEDGVEVNFTQPQASNGTRTKRIAVPQPLDVDGDARTASLDVKTRKLTLVLPTTQP